MPPLAIIIPPVGKTHVVELPEDDRARIEALREIVGGTVQAVPLPGNRLLVLNEEGKLRPHSANRTATAIALTAEAIRRDDYVAGTAAIIPREALQ